MRTRLICPFLTGLFFVAAMLTMPGSFEKAHAKTVTGEERGHHLLAQMTRSDPRWQPVDDRKDQPTATESGSSAPSQRWYDRPARVEQRPSDQPATQQPVPPPVATEAPPALRHPHMTAPVERKDDVIGGGRPGGVLPDMPQRGMPGRDMGPAGAARQQPSASPLDRSLGPGAVSSGRTQTDRGWVQSFRSHDDDGTIFVFYDSEDAQDPREMEYWGDDGSYHQEEYHAHLPLVDTLVEDDASDENNEGEHAESRSGDPDAWSGDEAPPSRTGVGGTVRDRKPAGDGRVGGEADEERESVHVTRPELDVEQQVTDRSGQLGDRRERGPDLQIQLPEDRLGDPSGGGGGIR